jgi:hypothetical protein
VGISRRAKSQTLMTAVRRAVVQEAQALFNHMVESFASGYNRARSSKRASARIVRAGKKQKARTSNTRTPAKQPARATRTHKGKSRKPARAAAR